MGYCCVNCFDEKFIQRFIKEKKTKGNCDYCNSKNVYIASTKDVGKFIREGIYRAYKNVDDEGIYWDSEEKECIEGENILDILNNEGVFSEKIYSIEKESILCNDLIKDSGPNYYEIKDGDLDPIDNGHALLVLKNLYFGREENRFCSSWSRFKYIVKHYSRFFDLESNQKNREALFRPILKLIKRSKVILYKGHCLWRARIIKEKFKDDKESLLKIFGPPPLNNSCNNRMNPIGISYTYLSDDEETCIAEIKPYVGDIVYLAKFIVKRDLTLLDLSLIPKIKIKSIFDSKYDHDMRWAKDFIKMFIDDISKPVLPSESELEYIPTQVIAEFIRNHGYDGIKYQSSQNTSGYNYTLFYGPKEEGGEHLHNKHIKSFVDVLDIIYYKKYRIKGIKYETEYILR